MSAHIYVYLRVTYRGFCRFLALKNLAAVFLQLGSTHHENALHCYLQAVDIDSKDSVVWNQLGTLSCSMGSLSISRWAFEQGLLCSPNNCKHLNFLIFPFSSGYLMTCSLVFLFLFSHLDKPLHVFPIECLLNCLSIYLFLPA